MAAATKMTQSQIVKELAEATGTNSKVAKQFMTSFAEMAVRETKKNGMFVIPGIGRLVRVDRKARTGRNPATGEAIKIPAKKVVKFRVAKAVKDAIVPPEEEVTSNRGHQKPRLKHETPRRHARGFCIKMSMEDGSTCEPLRKPYACFFSSTCSSGLQGILEILDAFSQTLRHFGNLLSAEQQNSDYQNDQKLRQADGP